MINKLKTQNLKLNNLNYKNISINSAFTLIELLVVMAIIGVLTSMSVFAMQGARESGRNANRKGDLEAIKQAFELFKSDCGRYPSALPAVGSSLTGSAALGCSPANSNVYLTARPGDVISGRLYSYTPNGSRTAFTLCTALEGEGTSATGCGSCGSAPCTYKVTNP